MRCWSTWSCSADGGVDARLGGGPYNAARTLARLGAADHLLRRAGRRSFRTPAPRRPRRRGRRHRRARPVRRADHAGAGRPRPVGRRQLRLLPDRHRRGGPGLPAARRGVRRHPRRSARRGRRGHRRAGRRPRRRPRPGHGADRVGRRAAGAGRRAAGRPGDARPQLPPRRHRRPGGLPGPHRPHRRPGRRGQGERGRPRLPLPRLVGGRGGRIAARRRAGPRPRHRRPPPGQGVPARRGRSRSRSPPSRSWTRSAPATPSAAASSPGGRRTASPGPT